jgi:NAD(P)-dependent dehydrogenase (short-subunit alcohol dehydrogenase family)
MGPLATLDLDTARRFFELRYWGAVTAVKHAAGQLRRGGSIVLTGGIAAQRPHAGWTIGASICGAMEALTRALAVELAPQGLRVNLVSPGIIETGLWSNLTDAARGELYRGVAAALPVGRVGRPADVAAIYVALMANGFATGQSYVVDGGGLLV